MVVVVFVLPLKRVKGNVKDKLKKIDYIGCVLMLASAVLILIPLSWYVLSNSSFVAMLMCKKGRDTVCLELSRSYCSSSHRHRSTYSVHLRRDESGTSFDTK
jgi:hypothetical protein